MTKHTILFLAANPFGTDRLALDEEARAIQEEFERGAHRDEFEFVTRWAVQPLDLLRALRKLKPVVVHFSGHGTRRDAGESLVDGNDSSMRSALEHGLYFQGLFGQAQLVLTRALDETFGAAGASVKVVVLNACYSAIQAEALLVHVGCVVGMGGPIHAGAARAFAIGFYGGLGEKQSVGAAYRQGLAAISLEGQPEGAKPQLKVRPGIDVEGLMLANARNKRLVRIHDRTPEISKALESLATRGASISRLKDFVSIHKEVLLGLPIPLTSATLVESVKDLAINRRLKPDFTQFRFELTRTQSVDYVVFIVLLDPNVPIFSRDISTTTEIQNEKNKLHRSMRTAIRNYLDYSSTAVAQDLVKAIPLSVLQRRRTPCFEAYIIASRRRYLTQKQLDQLARRNARAHRESEVPVKVITYDLLIDGMSAPRSKWSERNP